MWEKGYSIQRMVSYVCGALVKLKSSLFWSKSSFFHILFIYYFFTSIFINPSSLLFCLFFSPPLILYSDYFLSFSFCKSFLLSHVFSCTLSPFSQVLFLSTLAILSPSSRTLSPFFYALYSPSPFLLSPLLLLAFP